MRLCSSHSVTDIGDEGTKTIIDNHFESFILVANTLVLSFALLGAHRNYKCDEFVLTVYKLRLTSNVTAFLFSENSVSASSLDDTSRPLTFFPEERLNVFHVVSLGAIFFLFASLH